MGLADIGFPDESFCDGQDLSLSADTPNRGPVRKIPRPLSASCFAVRLYGV